MTELRKHEIHEAHERWSAATLSTRSTRSTRLKDSKVRLVKEFAIKEGRSGDFIEDRNGKKIPLTALIFGRHHKAFDVADYVQIGQPEPGRATLYVTLKNDKTGLGETGSDLACLFDLSNVDIDFDFKLVDKPIRTAMGKLKLRV